MNIHLTRKAFVVGTLVLFIFYSVVDALITNPTLLIACIFGGLAVAVISLYEPEGVQVWMERVKGWASTVVKYFDTKIQKEPPHDHLSNVL